MLCRNQGLQAVAVRMACAHGAAPQLYSPATVAAMPGGSITHAVDGECGSLRYHQALLPASCQLQQSQQQLLALPMFAAAAMLLRPRSTARGASASSLMPSMLLLHSVQEGSSWAWRRMAAALAGAPARQAEQHLPQDPAGWSSAPASRNIGSLGPYAGVLRALMCCLRICARLTCSG